MTTDSEKNNWWATLPGILTSMATLITAIGGLLVILNVNGYSSRSPDKSKENNFVKTTPKKELKIKSSSHQEVQKRDFRKQLFKGNVGEFQADFELTFDPVKRRVRGIYHYPKRSDMTYDLVGAITNKGLELTEITANQVTATCFLKMLNADCYTGRMINTNGKQFEMSLCKVVP